MDERIRARLAEAKKLLEEQLQSFAGTANTPLVQAQIVNMLNDYVRAVTDDQETAGWFSVRLETADNGERIVVEPGNIFSALLLCGYRDPPRKTVVCRRYETAAHVWELVDGKVTVRPKDAVDVSVVLLHPLRSVGSIELKPDVDE